MFYGTYFINTLRPGQNGCHFPDDIFKWIFLNENVWISINISLKFVPRGPINNIPTLVQVMAGHLVSAKPLSEPMMVRLPPHICVTRPQWVNSPGTGFKVSQTGILYIVIWTSLNLNLKWLIVYILLARTFCSKFNVMAYHYGIIFDADLMCLVRLKFMLNIFKEDMFDIHCILMWN